MKTLKHYRLESGLSVQEVAEHMQVSKRVIYSWEAGSRGIGMPSLVKLLSLYQVDPPISTVMTLVPALVKKEKPVHS